MPTYKNDSARPLGLITWSGNEPRIIQPGELFTAHPSEIAASLLSPIDGDEPLMRKVSDAPETPRAPRPDGDFLLPDAQ